MGRNTEIYMFNKDKASTNLYLDLKLNKLYETSFEEFIKRRKNEIGNSYELATIFETKFIYSLCYIFRLIRH